MPTSVGPNTFGEENLVFGYDTGDTVNSYRGEPTTNYLTTALTPNSATKESFTGTVTENVELAPDGTYTAHRFQVDAGYTYQVLSIPANTTITYSGWVKSLDGNTYVNRNPYIWNYNNPTYGVVVRGTGGMTPEWRKFSMTYTTLTHQNSFSISYGSAPSSGLSGTYALWKPQLEYKPHATPFVAGTRSATQGLIDLTGNSTINISNSSFTSDALTAFDGSGDYFDLGADQVFKSSGGWTVESVVNYDSVAGGYNNLTSPANFIGSDTTQYNSWYWSVLNGKLALWNISPGVWKYGSTTLQANTWYHTALVCSNDGTSYQMYLNGVAEGGDHTTYSWNASYAGLRVRYIGAGRSTLRYVNGTIPITKLYNRALTASEIKANYNAIKGRFNI